MNILLTGTSSGIGKATAQLLLDAGHHVYGTVRKPADAEQLALHPAFTALIMDVTDRPSIVAVMDTIRASGEPLHAVINNSGVALSGPLETLPESDYRHQFDVNVFGLLAVCQEALPLLHDARAAGINNVKIINVSSVSGYITSMFTSMYSASKFAVEAITDGLRRELLPFGIDAISVAPGPVKTPIWEKAKSQTKPYEGNRYAYVLEKLGPYTDAAAASGVTPEKVASTILKALEDERPRPDQLVMKKSYLIRLVMMLPKRMQDKMLLKNLDGNKRY
jgi:NAD(P)-dependent dehydrogenase (short-subunit alcohol dehydrogenase family)